MAAKKGEVEQNATYTVLLERRQKALELRKMGAATTQIAAALGVTPAVAHRDIQLALTDLRSEAAEDIRKLELERLDVVILSFWNRMRNGEARAAEVILKAMQRRAMYLGLDVPDGMQMATLEQNRPRIMIQEASAPALLAEARSVQPVETVPLDTEKVPSDG